MAAIRILSVDDEVKEIEEAHVKWQNEQKTEKLNRLKSV